MKKKNIILTILLVLLLLGINYFLSFKKTYKFDNKLKDIAMSVTNILAGKKNIDISDDMLISKNSALEKDNKELKELLSLKETVTDYNIINSTVINRNMEYFYKELTIDKGYNDGTDIGQAVITKDGLVGRIEKVSKHTSTVKLISSSDLYNMLSVVIKTSVGDVYGILSSYDQNNNSFLIEGIDELAKIKEGNLVMTTGLGNNYPSGITIGKVVRISKDNFDLAYILKVEPSSNLESFHYVAVLSKNNG